MRRIWGLVCIRWRYWLYWVVYSMYQLCKTSGWTVEWHAPVFFCHVLFVLQIHKQWKNKVKAGTKTPVHDVQQDTTEPGFTVAALYSFIILSNFFLSHLSVQEKSSRNIAKICLYHRKNHENHTVTHSNQSGKGGGYPVLPDQSIHTRLPS